MQHLEPAFLLLPLRSQGCGCLHSLSHLLASRVVVGLRLGTPLCQPHTCCHCGAEVDCMAIHGLSCKWSEGCHHWHAALNNIVQRSLSSAQIPSRLEPTGLDRSDGHRPDGVTIIPWKFGKLMVWDVICPDSFAPSYLASATSASGAVAALAEDWKKVKYSYWDSSHTFIPLAIETLGVFGPSASSFFKELGRRLLQVTGETNSFLYLCQRISVAVQRGNTALVLGTIAS